MSAGVTLAANFRPQERLEHVPGVCALLPVRSRRLARSITPVRRGATSWNCCGPRINLAPRPPHPPTRETGPNRGQDGQVGGGAIAFPNAGARGVCGKPVEQPAQQAANPHGSKRWCLTGCARNPRVVPFFPRIWSVFPRVDFLGLPATPLSISLFLLRKEEEEEGRAGKTGIHGFFGCLKKHPRVWCPIHGFFGDEFLGKTQCWCGFAGDLAPFPVSTGRNAYMPGRMVRNG